MWQQRTTSLHSTLRFVPRHLQPSQLLVWSFPSPQNVLVYLKQRFCSCRKWVGIPGHLFLLWHPQDERVVRYFFALTSSLWAGLSALCVGLWGWCFVAVGCRSRGGLGAQNPQTRVRSSETCRPKFSDKHGLKTTHLANRLSWEHGPGTNKTSLCLFILFLVLTILGRKKKKIGFEYVRHSHVLLRKQEPLIFLEKRWELPFPFSALKHTLEQGRHNFSSKCSF